MSKTGDHAEDTEHALEHAGRGVGGSFADSVTPPEDDESLALLAEDDSPR